MGKECSLMGVFKLPVEADEFELSLELSIGGIYGKSENPEKKLVKKNCPFEENDTVTFSKSDFSCVENGMKSEKFLEYKLFLEGKKFEARVKDREIRERDVFSPDLSRKKRKSPGCDSGRENGSAKRAGLMLNGLELEGCSSADSDKQSTSQKGENSSSTSRIDNSENRESNHSSPHPRSSPNPTQIQNHTPKKANNACSKRAPSPSKKTSNGASILHMPYVSTTITGPNGKTVTGFLYKYTKTEVSIMCVCHGSSFSPAEFVEHAGGVDISYPLRHITIIPPGLSDDEI